MEHEPAFDEADDFFHHMKRLQDLKGDFPDISDLPEHEQRLIREYHHAFTEACTLAYFDIVRDDYEPINEDSMTGVYKGEKEDLIAWLRHNGGILNPKIEIRKAPADGPQEYGLFAKEDLGANELLISVPKTLVVYERDDEHAETDFECGTVYQLINLMYAEDEEEIESSPYIKELLAEEKGQVPSLWSPEGKKLLQEVVGTPATLPPDDLFQWIISDWLDGCEGMELSNHTQAAALVGQRSWFGRMIPVVDLLRHSNGYGFNVDVAFVYSNDFPVEVRSLRAISAGEELRASRNECRLCFDKTDNMETPDIFSRTGFIERYPQTWEISTGFNRSVAFEINEVRGNDGEILESKYRASILDESVMFGPSDLPILRGELKRLNDLAGVGLSQEDTEVSKYEFKMMNSYLQALRTAIRASIEEMDGEAEVNCDFGDFSCEFSKAAMSYDKLEPQEDDVIELTTCDIDEMLSFADWNTVDDLQSMYQHLTVSIHPQTNDTCFDLDNTVQICTNYRPQYHELQVQYAAQFLPDIRRVAWIGGGDSMLAHELLKYPNLELAIGLELDQNVTRYSFKYFGAQPHWDNEKIEWWYGDASKSLLMLPDEYFNSFDLVIIDLSETVMSFKVTNEIDVLDAVALLMKPDGIFVKNEFYSEKMSQLFKHTLQYYRGDIPMICIQAMNLGSNAIDFLRAVDDKMVDHPVEMSYVKSVERSVEMMHDSIINRTALHLDCHLKGGFQKNIVEQQRSPGITMIIDVENVAVDMSMTNMIQVLENSVEAAGLAVVKTVSGKTKEPQSFMITLAEGYLMARIWPERKYCAIDLMIWGSFQKHDQARDGIIKALGSTRKLSPSYRIVTGGMFGVQTWKEDEVKRGPADHHQTCLSDDARTEARTLCDETYGVDNDMDLLTLSVRKSLDMMNEASSTIIVVCGVDKNDCLASSALSKYTTHTITPIYTCEDYKDTSDDQKVPSAEVAKCTHELRSQLFEISKSKKIGGIVMDAHIPKIMASTLLKLCMDRWLFRKVFSKDLIVLAVTQTEWMRTFVDRFRRNIIRFEPVFMSEYTIRGKKRLDLTLVSAGDPDFWKRMNKVQHEIEAEGPSVEVHHISGGKVPFMPDFEPEIYFPVNSYNATPPLEQWLSQEPLGMQTILQIEADESGSMKMDDVKDAITGLLKDVNIWESLGEGLLCTGYLADAWTVVLYDGRDHLDVNIYWRDENFPRVQAMEEMWLDRLDAHTVLRDIFPRGVGKVVNFKENIGEREIPHWAYPITEESQKVIDAYNSN